MGNLCLVMQDFFPSKYLVWSIFGKYLIRISLNEMGDICPRRTVKHINLNKTDIHHPPSPAKMGMMESGVGVGGAVFACWRIQEDQEKQLSRKVRWEEEQQKRCCYNYKYAEENIIRRWQTEWLCKKKLQVSQPFNLVMTQIVTSQPLACVTQFSQLSWHVRVAKQHRGKVPSIQGCPYYSFVYIMGMSSCSGVFIIYGDGKPNWQI